MTHQEVWLDEKHTEGESTPVFVVHMGVHIFN